MGSTTPAPVQGRYLGIGLFTDGALSKSQVQTKLRTDTKLGQDYGLSRDKVAKYIS